MNHSPRPQTLQMFLILEWLRKVAPEKRIADLDAQILEHEREAIVAWAIQGYKRLVEQGGYTIPTSHLALTDQMAADNNSVRHFLTSNGSGLKWGPDFQVTLADLHMKYWSFGLIGGGRREPITKFAEMMKELAGTLPFDVDFRGANEIVYTGIGIQ